MKSFIELVEKKLKIIFKSIKLK